MMSALITAPSAPSLAVSTVEQTVSAFSWEPTRASTFSIIAAVQA
jgi:hypothetical protein